MQKYKQAALSIAILTIILSAGFYNIPNSQENNSVESKANLASQEQILNSFENNDYDSWKKIILSKNKQYQNLDQADFNSFIKARLAARSGDYEQAINLSKKLTERLKNKISLS